MNHTPASTSARDVERLRQALETIEQALTSVDYARLVEAEPELAEAVSRVGAGAARPLGGVRLTEEIAATRRTLARVERLGANLHAVARISQLAQGQHEYESRGAHPATLAHGSVDLSA